MSKSTSTMNLFFGKISKKFDSQQIKEGYYISPKGSSWFGDLEIGDYVYLIGGDKIQLWRAKEWGTKGDQECLNFEILNNNLGITVSQFIVLKFFTITRSLSVLTSRSARNKAFFRLDIKEEITIEEIINSEFYKNPELYRKIRIVSPKDVVVASKDIQLTYENNTLQLVDNDFIEDNIKIDFLDNLTQKGGGARMKDNVLDFFSEKIKSLPVVITYKEVGFRSFYDTFFCEYRSNEKYFLVGAFWKGNDPEDLTGTFIKQGIWKNGFEDQLHEEVNAVAVGSNIAIKAAYVREKKKAVMMIKARGVVKSNPHDGRLLEVEWDEDFVPFEVPIGSYIKDTIKEVTNRDHIYAIWNSNGAVENDPPTIGEVDKKASHMKYSLNQILFGPPGTGKTYATITKAIAIVDDISEKEVLAKYPDRKVLKDYFTSLFYDHEKKEGRIAFTTFHQSMSYEDFVEGIKPNVNNKNVEYAVKPGIFQQMAETATDNWLDSKKGKSSELSFEEAFTTLKEEVEEEPDTKFAMKKEGKDFKIIGFTDKSIQFEKSSGSKNHTLSINTLRDYFYGNKQIRLTGIGIYYPSIIEKLKSYTATSVIDKAQKRYVLIIDEINRGNVSAIFGELITLLEPDKRLGEDEALEVILPYSQDKFGVPSNLYIIGTMNTADRSVEALDTALRRRFSFVEVMPKPSLLSPSVMICDLFWKYKDIDWDEEPYKSEEAKLFSFLGVSDELFNERKDIWTQMKGSSNRAGNDHFKNFVYSGFNLELILETINNRIEALLDRDHIIGHSYFIKVNDKTSLVNAFKNCIIPLLQEYFYGDYEKINLVLGDGFIYKDAKSAVTFAGNNFTSGYGNTERYIFSELTEENIDRAIKKLLNIQEPAQTDGAPEE